MVVSGFVCVVVCVVECMLLRLVVCCFLWFNVVVGGCVLLCVVECGF